MANLVTLFSAIGSTSVRRFLAACGIAAFLGCLWATSLAAQDCSSCRPGIISGAVGLHSGNYDICFQDDATNQFGSVDDDYYDGIENYWGPQFTASGTGITFSKSNGTPSSPCSSSSIIVSISTTMSSSYGAETHPTVSPMTIQINATYLSSGSAGSRRWTGAHEGAHLLGLDDTAANCNQLSITGWSNPGDIPSGLVCGDVSAFNGIYPADPSYNNTEWGPSVHEEDCWDYEFVRYVYYWTGHYWQESDRIVLDSWTDCSPPI